MKIALVVLLLIAGLSGANAQKTTANQLVSISVDPKAVITKAGRATLVTLLSIYCQEIIAALPTITPNEEAWISNELKTSDMQKINRALATKEYARSSARDTFQTCVDRTAKLLVEQNRRGSNDITRLEAASLVSLAVNFNSGTDIETYAKRAGLNIEHFRLDFLSAVR